MTLEFSAKEPSIHSSPSTNDIIKNEFKSIIIILSQMISLRKLFGLSRGLLRVARPALFQNHLLYQQRVYFAKISKKKEEKL